MKKGDRIDYYEPYGNTKGKLRTGVFMGRVKKRGKEKIWIRVGTLNKYIDPRWLRNG